MFFWHKKTTENDEAVQDFIRHHTRFQQVPFLPELSLHLADGAIEPLWQIVQCAAGMDVPPPFWAFAWVGGQGLARYILDNPEVVRGKRVLDFASGSGIVGIAAAKAGAARVWCCDIDPLAQKACAMNARANGVELQSLEIKDIKKPAKGVDVVLAGDVCYEHLMAHRTLAWLRLCAAAGQTVLLGDPGRAYAPKEAVVERARYTIPALLAIEPAAEREVVVLSLIMD